MKNHESPEPHSLEWKKETSRRVLGVLCAGITVGLKYGELMQRIFRGKIKAAFAKENCPWRSGYQVYRFFNREKP